MITSANIILDDKISTEERRKEDSLATVSEIFNLFVKNYEENFCLGENVCVDEMLVGFRRKGKFKMFLPSNPNKYGRKVMCLTDSRSGYLYNACVYCGKGIDSFSLTSEDKKMSAV